MRASEFGQNDFHKKATRQKKYVLEINCKIRRRRILVLIAGLPFLEFCNLAVVIIFKAKLQIEQNAQTQPKLNFRLINGQR